MEENKFKFPTEMVDLPSKGLLYPEGHPLASGQVEMKYMTAREEDILTNQNYIKQGIVIDKLLQSMLITKFDYKDLLIGDKDAIMIAARILGYGKDYSFRSGDETITVDLTQCPMRYLDESKVTKGINSFEYTFPSTKNVVTYKILTGKDEKQIQSEIEGLKKIDKNASAELSTRLKYLITSVNGNEDKKVIREFVDNYLLAKDSRAFREHLKTTQPDVELTAKYVNENGVEEDIVIPITANFFWPDSGV
jgi:hypothetical protein